LGDEAWPTQFGHSVLSLSYTPAWLELQHEPIALESIILHHLDASMTLLPKLLNSNHLTCIVLHIQTMLSVEPLAKWLERITQTRKHTKSMEYSPSTKVSARYTLRRVLVFCSADPYAAAELAAFTKEQATTLVEEISKNTGKKKHRAAESTRKSMMKKATTKKATTTMPLTLTRIKTARTTLMKTPTRTAAHQVGFHAQAEAIMPKSTQVLVSTQASIANIHNTGQVFTSE
jgi:hypothetical protein